MLGAGWVAAPGAAGTSLRRSWCVGADIPGDAGAAGAGKISGFL